MRLAPLRLVSAITAQAARRFLQVNGLFLACGLAFSLLLYSVPLVLLIVAILGHTAGGSERALAEVQLILRQMLPDIEQTAVQGLSTAMDHRRELGLYGTLLFALFSTTTFGSARFALNVLFGVERRRGFFRGVGVDALMILLLAGLFAITLALNAALGAIRAASHRVPLVGPILESAWFTVSEILGVVFVLALFYVVYRVCPARSLGRRGLAAATLTGAALLELSRWAFGWYAGAMRETAVIYGAAGSVVFFILWLYYGSLSFLFGGTIGWAVEHRLGIRSERDAPDPVDTTAEPPL